MIQCLEHVFFDTSSPYGKRCIQAELLDLDCKTGVYAIDTVMKNVELIAIRPKKKQYYSNQGG